MAFQSTRPVRGATPRSQSTIHRRYGFNPRAPCGARRDIRHRGKPTLTFQSTRPVRGATCISGGKINACNVSIHAPRAGRDLPGGQRVTFAKVSIHAPRAGRDSALNTSSRARQSFNPRAPCGARPDDHHDELRRQKFQSTRPVRGATASSQLQSARILFQSTRPVRGATQKVRDGDHLTGVSIHAPRAGRDCPRPRSRNM